MPISAKSLVDRHPVSSSLKQQQDAATREVLAGLIERVTFHSPENGFCVLRINARGHRDLVTAVGHAATISARRMDHRDG
jgi:exodeoxyribonuclease V alpha subunit